MKTNPFAVSRLKYELVRAIAEVALRATFHDHGHGHGFTAADVWAHIEENGDRFSSGLRDSAADSKLISAALAVARSKRRGLAHPSEPPIYERPRDKRCHNRAQRVWFPGPA